MRYFAVPFFRYGFYIFRKYTVETRVAVMSIIVECEETIKELNDMLHLCRQYIIGRMGIPYRERGINIISVAIDAPQDVISALSGRIGKLKGISIKIAYSNVKSDGKSV